MNPLRILIADDHDLVRRGVKALLQSHDGWQICAEANTGREAVAKAEELKPDIAILDIGMPDLNGLEAARRIRKVSTCNTEVLILSMPARYRLPAIACHHASDEFYGREIVDTGVRGYIVKSDFGRLPHCSSSPWKLSRNTNLSLRLSRRK